MRHEKSLTLKVSDMRTLAAFALVIVFMSLPITVRAQESAAQQAALQQRVDDQLRRIEALEAVLAQLKQEVTALKGLQGNRPARRTNWRSRSTTRSMAPRQRTPIPRILPATFRRPR